MNAWPAGKLPVLNTVNLDAVRAAVGPAQRVQYNKPHVYPMAAPMFVRQPGAERPRPSEGPLEIYVHIPFCNYKCNFCTYATRQAARPEQMERYVNALKKEVRWIDKGTPLRELYFGGGTPTVLPPDLLRQVLAAVWQRLQSLPGIVHTMECSPESITPEHVCVIKQYGMERASIGVQSLNDNLLERLNRHHSRHDALVACDLLVANGLMLNVDLIYGLPRQTEEDFADDFRTLIAHGVHSVTVYNLRINERTPIAGILNEKEDLELENLLRWRMLIGAIATELGLRQTRWHTFTRPTLYHQSWHPASRFENFASIGDQFGIGMSARSRLGDTVYRNHTEFSSYLRQIEEDRSPVEEIYSLGEEDRKALYIGQYLGNGRPLDRHEYEARFGCSFDEDYVEVLPRLRENGLIEEESGVISLTEIGKLVFDLVNCAFYPRRAQEWIEERQSAPLPPRKRRAQTPK